jgi:hypothetical protein
MNKSMEPITTPPTALVPSPKKSNPWGLLIGLLIILAIIVAGAYYAFTERVAPQTPIQTTQY